jgi:hypothetical protein
MVFIRSDFRLLSEEEVRTVTGKTWQEWCDLIDIWNGQTRSLAAVATYLMEQHNLRRLWAQMIAVYYKQEWCPQRRNAGA